MPVTRYFSLLFVALLLIGVAKPQARQRTEFEAVSVKPHGNNDRFLPPGVKNSQFSSGSPLYEPIAMAYGFRTQGPRFVMDGPLWLYSFVNAYDIEGTIPSGDLPANLSRQERSETIQQMLQPLLEDRFHLKVHRERREMPVYTITVAGGGVRLSKAEIEEKDCPVPQGNDATVNCHKLAGGIGRGLHGRAATIGELLSYVQSWTDKPLVDKTGINSLYRFETIPWLNSSLAGLAEGHFPVSELPSLRVWFDRMGLKMDTETAQVEVLVVDHVEMP